MSPAADALITPGALSALSQRPAACRAIRLLQRPAARWAVQLLQRPAVCRAVQLLQRPVACRALDLLQRPAAHGALLAVHRIGRPAPVVGRELLGALEHVPRHEVERRYDLAPHVQRQPAGDAAISHAASARQVSAGACAAGACQ
eukprot:354439-Chlamydomonas_euryale.AAC.2